MKGHGEQQGWDKEARQGGHRKIWDMKGHGEHERQQGGTGYWADTGGSIGSLLGTRLILYLIIGVIDNP